MIFKKVNNYSGRSALQFGHLISDLFTTNPQFEQVLGCASPKGAPQAIHLPAAISLAVWQ